MDMINTDLDESVTLIASNFEVFLELVGASGPH
jgi:hypothetical protein